MFNRIKQAYWIKVVLESLFIARLMNKLGIGETYGMYYAEGQTFEIGKVQFYIMAHHSRKFEIRIVDLPF